MVAMWYTPDRLGRGGLQGLGLGKCSEPEEKRERSRDLHVSGECGDSSVARPDAL